MSTRGRDAEPVAELPGALTFRKTIGEADVYAFAGLTGDFAPVHVDAVYAEATPIGERIAHGALLVGLFSTASSRWCDREGVDTLSYGYEGVRFIKPIRYGDTVAVSYAKVGAEPERNLIACAVEARNQHGEVVGVGTHLLWEFEDAVEAGRPGDGLT